MKSNLIKYISLFIAVIVFAISFVLSGGLFYFFGAYGFGGSHYECGNIDFRLSYGGYSAIINNEYLPEKNWRLVNDDDNQVNKHYWVGSNHTYVYVMNKPLSELGLYVDGQRCELFKE